MGGIAIDFIIKKEIVDKPIKVELKDDEFFLNIGGGASNAAYVLSRLSESSGMQYNIYFLTKLSKDHFNPILLDFFKKNRNIKLIKTKFGKVNAFSFIFSKNDRVIYTYRGDQKNLDYGDIEEDIDSLNFDWFYLSSSEGKSLKTFEKIIKDGKKNGKKAFLNPSLYMVDYIRDFIDNFDIIVLNKEEAFRLSKKDNIEDALEFLNKNSLTIITDGSRGVYFKYNDSLYNLNIPVNEVIDTTGAGDTFSSTFFHFFVKRKDNLIDSLIKAYLNSINTIKNLGTKHSLSENAINLTFRALLEFKGNFLKKIS